tara:strand:+ start:495 stop:857 length:363 start_codon:yes stop_codon:yes gene_type:complete
MPSYYDSTKNKPGKAEVKYQQGGQTGRKARGDSLFEKLQAARNASATGSPLGQISERELALLVKRRGRKGALGQLSEMERELLRRAKGMATGGQVKKMKGGGTVARGSGAARKQAFGKNG